MPYIVFALYMFGLGLALMTGINIYEEGLTVKSILYIIVAIVVLFLAWLGTYYILIGVIV